MFFTILEFIRHLNLTTLSRGLFTFLTKNSISCTLSRLICLLNLTKKCDYSIKLIIIITIHLLDCSGKSIRSQSTKRSIVNFTLSLVCERRISYLAIHYKEQAFSNLITIKFSISKTIENLGNRSSRTSNRCAAFRAKQTIYKYIRTFLSGTPLKSNFNAILFIRSRSSNDVLMKRFISIILNKIGNTIFSTKLNTIFCAIS